MDGLSGVAQVALMMLRAALVSTVLLFSTGCTAVQRILAPDDAPTRRSFSNNTVRHTCDTVAAFDRRPMGPPWPTRSRIDDVYMDEAMARRVETATVVDTDGSDHLPVVVRLREAPRVGITVTSPAQDQLGGCLT